MSYARESFNAVNPFPHYGSPVDATEVPLFDNANSNSNDIQEWPAENKPTQTQPVDMHAVSLRQKKSSPTKDRWLWEMAGAILSFICIVAVVAVLYRFHGQPLSAWKMPIAINSLISLFSTVAKAALLLPVAAYLSQLKWHYFAQEPHPLNDLQIFDDASRGPLGALQLLWELKGKALIASLASIITIVALAIDPFTQQIISLPSRSVPTSNTSATIAMAQVYDTGLSQDIRNILCKSSTLPRPCCYRLIFSLCPHIGQRLLPLSG